MVNLIPTKEKFPYRIAFRKPIAMICQVSGILSGVILLFLALFLNFQDNKRDMQILRMMGHNDREIQGIFVNVYWKILMFVFVISMPVSLIIAKLVQVSLEQAIEENMPFTFNVGVILLLVALLNIIYVLVKSIFSYQVKKIR